MSYAQRNLDLINAMRSCENANKKRILRDTLISENMKLVRIIAKKFRYYDLTNDDLMQEGVIGLMRAIELFDTNLNIKFSTYAKWWIYSIINRAVRSKHGPVRLPEYKQYKHIYNKTPMKIQFACIDEMNEIPDEQAFKDVYAIENINKAIDSLSVKKKNIFTKICGLRGCEKITTREASKTYGVSHQRIAEIKHDAIQMIRKRLQIERGK